MAIENCPLCLHDQVFAKQKWSMFWVLFMTLCIYSSIFLHWRTRKCADEKRNEISSVIWCFRCLLNGNVYQRTVERVFAIFHLFSPFSIVMPWVGLFWSFEITRPTTKISRAPKLCRGAGNRFKDVRQPAATALTDFTAPATSKYSFEMSRIADIKSAEIK